MHRKETVAEIGVSVAVAEQKPQVKAFSPVMWHLARCFPIVVCLALLCGGAVYKTIRDIDARLYQILAIFLLAIFFSNMICKVIVWEFEKKQ